MDEILKMAQGATREHTKVCDRLAFCVIFKISPPCNAPALEPFFVFKEPDGKA